MKTHALAIGCLCAALSPLVLAADAPAETSSVNPAVIARLARMGEHLRSLNTYEVKAELSRDVVLESGQKIKTLGTSTIIVDNKKRLFASLESDSQNRKYYYDGAKLTQYSPTLKYYTTVDVPDTIPAMIHKVEEHYGLQMPLEDLFKFGTEDDATDKLTVAAFVGPSTVNGQTCQHFAFRQEGVDWQLWMSDAKTPLPCKLVITTTDDPSHPEYSATYTWNMSPQVQASDFVFTPAQGDTNIPFQKTAE